MSILGSERRCKKRERKEGRTIGVEVDDVSVIQSLWDKNSPSRLQEIAREQQQVALSVPALDTTSKAARSSSEVMDTWPGFIHRVCRRCRLGRQCLGSVYPFQSRTWPGRNRVCSPRLAAGHEWQAAGRMMMPIALAAVLCLGQPFTLAGSTAGALPVAHITT